MGETIQTGYDTVMQNRRPSSGSRSTAVQYDAYVAARRDPRMRELPIVEFVRLDNKGARRRQRRRGAPRRDQARRAARRRRRRARDEHRLRPRLLPERSLRARQRAEGTGVELELDARAWGPNTFSSGWSTAPRPTRTLCSALPRAICARRSIRSAASGAPRSSSATSPR